MKSEKDWQEAQLAIRMGAACLGAVGHVLQEKGITAFRQKPQQRVMTGDEVCQIAVDCGQAVIQTIGTMILVAGTPPTQE